MTAETYPSEGVSELYDWVTDLMAQTHGGYLHGGYWTGPDDSATMAQAAEALTGVVVEPLLLAPGQHVLDVGSGNGKTAFQVAAGHGVAVSGVTISEYQVELADKLAREQGLSGVTDFRFADMRDLPFPDATFDAAFAIESVCHIPDRTRAFAEIGRVLRPGGRVSVTDFVLREPITDSGTAARVAAALVTMELGPILPREEYEAVVHAAGLEVVGFTDIREQVWPSWQVVADDMWKARDSVGDRLSDEEFQGLVDHLLEFGSFAEVGYTVVVAQKPLG